MSRTATLWSACFFAIVSIACVSLAADPATIPTKRIAQRQSFEPFQGTRMLEQPDVHGDVLVFVYADDLWIAHTDGSGIRRLTTHSGRESSPRFSPDGQLIAFSAQYDGNTDVYTVPTSGGTPERLTWHPDADVVQDFTPDGQAVLFMSQREVHSRRFQQLFTIPLAGGHPTKLPIPHAFSACYSPDGTKIAYTPRPPAFTQWKNYRGGTYSRIWIYDTRDHSVEEIPQPAGRCNDASPMWVGERVWFRSDRDGEFNLYSFAPASGTDGVTAHTTYADYPVLSCAADATQIAYEQAGRLNVVDAATAEARVLKLDIRADLNEVRTRLASGASNIRSGSISPSAKRAVFGFRGEIVTVPAKKGDARNLTHTTGVHEQLPVWSPDGKTIAYLSDESGEYELKLAASDGKGEVRTLALTGAGFYDDLVWSPDSKQLSYTDNAWALFVLDVESGAVTKVAEEPLYGPIKTLHHAWSPDSKWLAYTLGEAVYFKRVYLYELATGTSHAITDGLSDVAEPVFDASGKYLYFSASTDAGPGRTWFAQSNQDIETTNALYVAVLSADEASPLAPESDEEESAEDEDEEEDADEEEADSDEADEADDEEDATLVEIDFEGLTNRILPLPIPNAYYHNLVPGKAGKLFYLKTDEASPFGTGPGDFCVFDLEERKETELAEDASWFTLTPDGANVLLATGRNWSIAAAGSAVKEGALDLDSVEVKVDPRAEWPQILDEVWRVNRDWFYDPGMHGCDWPAMRAKYFPFLAHLTTRRDLNRLVQWMCSELGVGHHRIGGGDFPNQPVTIPGGLLGADYEITDGRYRFAKVYGGLNWNPNLRSPLTAPGVNVQAGEYLLAVDGEDLRAPANLYRPFENTAGKIVELTVGPNADGSESRTVEVVPIRSERSLRNRDWVEGNLARVTEASDGRVAYVHVPDTASGGHTYFKRYFFPQADRQALIVDERGNSGGLFADYVIDILRRPHISNWAMRYGADLETPLGAIQGPKVMLIDEGAGSGGDMLPWMFRKLGIGKLIGRPTWGGLVGVLGFPTLLDGASVTAPNLAIWTEDGFVVENVGVPPDIEVEQLPADVIAGRDPQLEQAIEVVLEELERNPPVERKRPPFPIRVRR